MLSACSGCLWTSASCSELADDSVLLYKPTRRFRSVKQLSATVRRCSLSLGLRALRVKTRLTMPQERRAAVCCCRLRGEYAPVRPSMGVVVKGGGTTASRSSGTTSTLSPWASTLPSAASWPFTCSQLSVGCCAQLG